MLAAVGLMMFAGVVETAQAQLFGSRSVGSPLSGRTGNRAGNAGFNNSSAGALEGTERFLRGNRSRDAFVGSSRSDQRGFVGAGQAIGVGRVRTATEGLQIDTTNTQRINRPLPRQPRRGMYYPRLEIAFELAEDVAPRSEIPPSVRIQRRVTNLLGDEVEVAIDGRTAVLRGTVESQHQADLAARVLSFEPGIDHVQSELQVRP
ncbi:MAG: BON domain-containing protein [Novipirellula sp. JB048]